MMISAPLVSHADTLAMEIQSATPAARLKLQPEFGKLLQDMAKSGARVPARLRNLHEQLLEEAIEARFDNFPI
ncbi:MAG: hypothetical protein AB8B71_14710 [Paracoccaceae bacterium]